MQKFKDMLANIAEIIISLMFIQGGFRVLADIPVVLEHPLSYLTTPPAIVTYGIMWIIIGLSLLNAKYFHLKQLHKYSLLAMFITCAYVLLLSVVIEGVQWDHMLTFTVGMLSGVLWIRWKLKTEYIKPGAFSAPLDNASKLG